MANCQKNTDYEVLTDAGQQIRNIALSTDGKTLKITLTAGGVECTFNIDSSQFTGIKISGNNLQIVDAISGLTQTASDAANKASVQVRKNTADRLEIIGIGDNVMNLQANIRYDSATDEVIMQY